MEQEGIERTVRLAMNNTGTEGQLYYRDGNGKYVEVPSGCVADIKPAAKRVAEILKMQIDLEIEIAKAEIKCKAYEFALTKGAKNV